MIKKTMKSIILLIFSIHLSFAAELVRVELRDVHGLWGGHDIVIRKDNLLLITVVTKTGKVEYHDGKINFSDFLLNLNPSVLIKYSEIIRPGLPDEARPVIKLYFDDGAMKEYSKWANENNKNFDQAYQSILGLEKTPGLNISTGKYEWKLRG